MGPKDGYIQKGKTNTEVFKTDSQSKSIEISKLQDLQGNEGITSSSGNLSFAKYSSFPTSTKEKNGGILGFFKKKTGLRDLHAPGDNHSEVKTQPKTKDYGVVDGKIKRAAFDLTEKERGGKTVELMRDTKSLLVEKVDADLALEREQGKELSDFTKELLNNLKKLGQITPSHLADGGGVFQHVLDEEEVAKKCIPFLQSFFDDTQKLKENIQDEDLVRQYEEKYSHLNEEERRVISVYAQLFSDTRGNLDVQGVKLTVIPDTRFKGPKAQVIHDPPRVNLWNRLEAMHFMDMSGSPLFAHEPNLYDMKQGEIGDCTLISGLIAIVNKDPDIIKSCMKDNGDTVTVRFYRSGKPVYITVQKTIPCIRHITLRKTGKEGWADFAYGNKGALWVNIMEKAFLAFKGGTNYSSLDSGDIKSYINAITNRKSTKDNLVGERMALFSVESVPSKVGVRDLLEKMRKSERAAFEEKLREEGKLPPTTKERNVLWNRKKAEIFFGITEKQYNDNNLGEMFRKNVAFKKWMDLFEKKIGGFTDNGIRSVSELSVIIDSMTEKDFPVLNIPGLDEKKMREHFIKKLKEYASEKAAIHSMARDYEYSSNENRVFNNIKQHTDAGDIVTAGAHKLRFSEKQESSIELGQSGIYGNHAYAVLGATEKTVRIRGRDVQRKFVIVANPWQEKSRLYDEDGFGFYQGPVDSGNVEKMLYNNHGVFLVELRDFNYNFAFVQYQ